MLAWRGWFKKKTRTSLPKWECILSRSDLALPSLCLWSPLPYKPINDVSHKLAGILLFLVWLKLTSQFSLSVCICVQVWIWVWENIDRGHGRLRKKQRRERFPLFVSFLCHVYVFARGGGRVAACPTVTPPWGKSCGDLHAPSRPADKHQHPELMTGSRKNREDLAKRKTSSAGV